MKDLNEMKSVELKQLAKSLKVPNWWNLSKANLIKGIEETGESQLVEAGAGGLQSVGTGNVETQPVGTGNGELKINTPMKISEVIKTLENIFDKLNMIYFDNSLPKAVITVQSAPHAYGHCSVEKIWETDSTIMYEINLSAEFINRPIQYTSASLCHEMIHLYCLEKGIADTSQKGRYHNKNFKAEAEARDLVLTYDRTNGYSKTEPTEAFTAKLTEAGIDTMINLVRTFPAKIMY